MPRPKLYPAKKVIGFDQPMLNAIDEWRAKQKPLPNFSDAVRGLVQLSLQVNKSGDRLADEMIDEISKPSATKAEKSGLKKRLIKGSVELPGVKKDQPTRRK